MTMLHNEVGFRIRNVRCRQGRTQAQLAHAMNCTAAHVSNIENGMTIARISEILLIAEYLRVDPRFITFDLNTPELELAKALLSPNTQDQGTIAHVKETTDLVRCLLSKPQSRRQKALAAWKAVAEMA